MQTNNRSKQGSKDKEGRKQWEYERKEGRKEGSLGRKEAKNEEIGRAHV